MQHQQIIPLSTSWEPAKFEYTKRSYAEMFQVLQSLRQHEVFCDIKLETDDGTIIFGHKVVLASASPYFQAMFTHFAEKNKELVVIRELDSVTLQLLIDFIYSGKIMVTENNVQNLLPAANLLQLQEIKEACCGFLQTQLHFTNCLGVKELADLHSCPQLLTSSELDVIEGDEFLSLSSDQVVKLISSDELTVPYEEKVFECVIRWVTHELDSRKCMLPQLMEHVRLPLLSKNYILTKVIDEPLLNNGLCKNYIMEALNFHSLGSDQLIGSIPKNIRTKHRLGDKVILVISGSGHFENRTEWYDPKINRWQFGPEMTLCRVKAGLAVLKNNFVFAMGGHSCGLPVQTVNVLDLSSELPCWKSSVDMLVKRSKLGVGVINNCLYAVGGYDGANTLNSAELFDCSTQEQHMVSSMCTRRADFGIGVLNNLLYAVGGYDYSTSQRLNSVECYHPSLDAWIPVAEMHVRRNDVGVGVLDGVLYAVGGGDRFGALKSVEAYSPATGVWTTIEDMRLPRQNAGVVALDGLLYVVGGWNFLDVHNSVEVYNPITNTWSMLEASMNVPRRIALAIERPAHF
ncbi:unnamed protein product [Macrosiphum euphorbiae]|uniref:Kelch-like protein diablo n=1 Tax=Macrosiphum euphorbiae TaxID=13131 RepID=A0AAV0XWW6_9HEMI|nr:unnamed protein product [Macrosiphum euphorbiae]